ncbi:MAG: aerotolerance regulator BatA, partial [Flavobacterium sp.]|nr:aerotolerance regulator BatA [Flavobacterium sp.]
FIEPETASEITKEYGIKVYTIGIGTNGMAMFPYAYAPGGNGFLYQMIKVEIHEKLLKTKASKTGGKYFRATSNSKLKSIYDEINKLETSKIEELKFYDYDEKFRPFVLLGIALLLIELLLRNTIFKSFI